MNNESTAKTVINHRNRPKKISWEIFKARTCRINFTSSSKQGNKARQERKNNFQHSFRNNLYFLPDFLSSWNYTRVGFVSENEPMQWSANEYSSFISRKLFAWYLWASPQCKECWQENVASESNFREIICFRFLGRHDGLMPQKTVHVSTHIKEVWETKASKQAIFCAAIDKKEKKRKEKMIKARKRVFIITLKIALSTASIVDGNKSIKSSHSSLDLPCRGIIKARLLVISPTYLSDGLADGRKNNILADSYTH